MACVPWAYPGLQVEEAGELRPCHLGRAPWASAGLPADGTLLEESTGEVPRWAHLFMQLLNPAAPQGLPFPCVPDPHRNQTTAAVSPVLDAVLSPALGSEGPRFIIKNPVDSQRSEVKHLAHGDTTTQWPRQDLNPGHRCFSTHHLPSPGSRSSGKPLSSLGSVQRDPPRAAGEPGGGERTPCIRRSCVGPGRAPLPRAADLESPSPENLPVPHSGPLWNVTPLRLLSWPSPRCSLGISREQSQNHQAPSTWQLPK